MPTTFYTEEEYKKQKALAGHTLSLINAFDHYFKEEGEKEHKKDGNEKKYYRYIPLNRLKLWNMLYTLKNKLIEEEEWNNKHVKLLDVGCGIGTTLMLAGRLYYKPYGIEINKTLVDAGRRLSNHFYEEASISLNQQPRISHHDALRYDRYKEFDVIYYYCPIEDSKLQQKLELRIESKMKKGAYLIPQLKQDEGIKKNKKFIQVDVKDHGYDFKVYKKIR